MPLLLYVFEVHTQAFSVNVPWCLTYCVCVQSDGKSSSFIPAALIFFDISSVGIHQGK